MKSKKHDLTRKEALNFYSKMVLSRRTEERHDELFQRQMVPVYTHLGTGQEAVGCGVSSLLRPDDYLLGTHRGVAEFVGKGMSVTDIFLEYGGRVNSISGGRAGLHLHSPALNILPLTGSLGTDFSLAVGAGLSVRNKAQDRVVVDYFGEGAAEQADFHPAMNMAMLFNVPVIFCCCTNQFVEYHRYSDTTCAADIAPRAEAYCMPWTIVKDGNDMFAVGRAMKEAIAHSRASRGPYFIEFKTYRVAPHHTGDPCVYRSKEEVEEACKNDPIARAERALLSRKWASADDLKQVAEACDRQLSEAVQALVESDLPDPENVMEHAVAN